jgi:hypothetical protein
MQAGGFDKALDLLAAAEAGPLDEFQRARVDLLRGHVTFASGSSRDGAASLLRAARRLEPFDLDLARETYLSAWGAGIVAAEQSGEGDLLLQICRAARALPPTPGAPRLIDLMLDGLAQLITEGHAAAAATLQHAAKVLASIPVAEVLRWGWVATGASTAVWDDEGFLAISERQVQLVRDAGAPLPGAAERRRGRTVEWHLGKVFTKLGIGSRRELHAALAQLGQDSPPA